MNDEDPNRWWRAEAYTFLLYVGWMLIAASFEAEPVPPGQMVGLALVSAGVSFAWVYR